MGKGVMTDLTEFLKRAGEERFWERRKYLNYPLLGLGFRAFTQVPSPACSRLSPTSYPCPLCPVWESALVYFHLLASVWDLSHGTLECFHGVSMEPSQEISMLERGQMHIEHSFSISQSFQAGAHSPRWTEQNWFAKGPGLLHFLLCSWSRILSTVKSALSTFWSANGLCWFQVRSSLAGTWILRSCWPVFYQSLFPSCLGFFYWLCDLHKIKGKNPPRPKICCGIKTLLPAL